MSGQQQQAGQGIQPQLPSAQSWLSSLPGFSAATQKAAHTLPGAPPSSTGQAAQQQAVRPGMHQAQPNMQPSLVYTTAQQGVQHPYPAGLLTRVQVAQGPHLTTAMHSIPQYTGPVYRPVSTTPQAYTGHLAPLAAQSAHAVAAARPPVQSAANVYQVGQVAWPSAAQQQQHITNSAARAIHPQSATPVYTSEDDRQILPSRSLKRKARAIAGDARAEMEPVLEAALAVMAEDFISNAVAFACGLTRRRKGQRLDAADAASYLDRTWQLHIPGFEGPSVKPYRKYAAGPDHQERTAAVRKARAAAAKSSAQHE